MNRRTALKRAGALAVALGALEAVGPFSFAPVRVGASIVPSDIQFDISAFLPAPPQNYGTDVQFQLPPVHTVFLTVALERTPTRADQAEMNRALGLLEQYYPWGATHLVTFVAYGLPYFDRLPGGRTGRLVASHMPRLASDASRYVLEEAQPGPTDVSPANPTISKFRYNVNVRIERNDLLFTLRGDDPGTLVDVLAWLAGSGKLRGHAVASPAWNGLIRFTSSRYMFVQTGLPKAVARQHHLPYANFIQHQSPMWMGFADQQVNGAGPAPVCTFAGTSAARLTTAAQGDYFDNGSIQHVSHVILDMLQFFDMDNEEEPPGEDGIYTERVQYMFHAPSIAAGNKARMPTAAARRCCPTRTAGRTTPNAPRGASARPAASAGWGIFPASSAPPGRPTARPCTSAWTVQDSTRWTSPATATCPSSSSPSSCRPPSSSAPCAPARPRSTCRRSTASP